MITRWRSALAGVALSLLVIGVLVARRYVGRPGAAPVPDVTAPSDTRIRVQVLNATRVRGLGRRAMWHLRDRGFDVVELGTSPSVRDSTLVLDRSGHPEWAQLVADALGGARVEARPDSSRYLDVTVLLGAAWRPPAEPFYP
ncbi:MAG TPA: LytR C-terminal domain-containing protein [Gemmatimonadaceae bacterium]|nr:LytR C-terminal domain-containing protein [Gemmatimonadaceae bacterium]